jgi:dUTP pyrophosphatase
MDVLKIKKFNPSAIIPTRANPGDAGLDIASVEDITIPPQSWRLVDTGLGITVPKGTYGRLAPRSGVSTKGIIINAGVIDKIFCGKIKCIMINISDKSYEIKSGDRICQLILEKIVDECIIQEVDELEDTIRGSNGFGSTGV